jgi:hypothetical protein
LRPHPEGIGRPLLNESEYNQPVVEILEATDSGELILKTTTMHVRNMLTYTIIIIQATKMDLFIHD